MLEKFDMKNSKPIATAMDTVTVFKLDDMSSFIDATKYIQVI